MNKIHNIRSAKVKNRDIVEQDAITTSMSIHPKNQALKSNFLYFLLTTDMVFDIYDKNTDENDGYYLFQWIKNEDAWKLINYMIVITDADAFLQNTFSA